MQKWLAAGAMALAMLAGAVRAEAAAPSVADMARFSADAYAFTREAAWHAPRGVRVVHQVKRTATSGFQAIALLRESDDALIVAYTGSKTTELDRLDFAAAHALVELAFHPAMIAAYRQAAIDVGARGGHADPQSERYGLELVAAKIREAQAFYDDALAAAQKLRPRLSKDRVFVTGHSLGGFLAEVIGARNGVVTHAFDAQPGAKLVLGAGPASLVMEHRRVYAGAGARSAAETAHIGRFCTYPAASQSAAKTPARRGEDARSIDVFARDLAAGLRATSCE